MGTKIDSNTPVFIDESNLETFKAQNTITEVVDLYEGQLQELRTIGSTQVPTAPTYVYFPWSSRLLRTVDRDALFELRTNRNQNLITKAEQAKLAASTVGIAGMSVGSGIALALAYSGISDHIKIADHDALDTTNLNRLRESLLNVGKPKAHLAAQHLYEIDPFLSVDVYDQGVTADTIDAFFREPTLNVVIDEIDDFKMKVQLRIHAKKHGIPLLMFTSLGDNILIDVERFDLDPDLPIFHGILNDISEEILGRGEITLEDIRRYSVQLVGQQYIPTRALQSVAEMGKTLVGRPQLYSTIAVDGGLAAYAVRRLLLEGDLPSGRHFISFDGIFGIDSGELADSPERNEILKRMQP